MNDLFAWGVAVGAGLVGTVAVYFLTRAMQPGRLRRALRLLPLLLLLMPAPVPGYPGHFAPAFIVFVFEAVFQGDGEPLLAGVLLATAAVLGLLLAFLGSRDSKNSTDNSEATD